MFKFFNYRNSPTFSACSFFASFLFVAVFSSLLRCVLLRELLFPSHILFLFLLFRLSLSLPFSLCSLSSGPSSETYFGPLIYWRPCLLWELFRNIVWEERTKIKV